HTVRRRAALAARRQDSRHGLQGMTHLAHVDPEIAAAIGHEVRRQEEGLELIASENFVSLAVMEAAGSVMTNKYAEGYPGKRYYRGFRVLGVAGAPVQQL